MKRVKIFLGFLILVSTISFGQSSVWEIKSEDKTIFLGGTIHLLRPSDFPLPSEFDEAYSKASTLVFEADIAKLESPAFQQKLLAEAMYTEGKTLKTELSEEVYNILDKECSKQGLSLNQLQMLKPSMVVLTLAMVHFQKLGITSDGVDVTYHNKAIEDEKSLLYLESTEKQLDLIVNMGIGNENEFVRHSLNDFDKMDKELLDMLKSWKEGEETKFVEILEEMKSEFPKLYTDLILERNNSWLPQLQSYFETDEVEFVLVGYAHLFGEDGLLELLKQQGYQVNQFVVD